MTSEKIIEEIYYEAFEYDFIDELRKKIDELRSSIEYCRHTHHELVYMAYYIVKSQKINQNY